VFLCCMDLPHSRAPPPPPPPPAPRPPALFCCTALQVYLFLHWCFCVSTFLVSWLCWRHFWLHTVLVVGMGLMSLWNGANFYFTVFAKR